MEAQADLVVLAGCLVVISRAHRGCLSEPDYQHSPGTDPVLLRDGLLWARSVHEAALARGVQCDRGDGAFCGWRHGYRTDHFTEGSRGKAGTIRQRMLQLRVMQEAEWVILAEGDRPDRKWQGDSRKRTGKDCRGIIQTQTGDHREKGGREMKILIVGSGGREHAIAWKIAQIAEGREDLLCTGQCGYCRVCRSVSISRQWSLTSWQLLQRSTRWT